MSIVPGDTRGAVVWSDSMNDCPTLPGLSRVQRCPDCGKYFFIDGIKPVDLRDDLWREFGIGSTDRDLFRRNAEWIMSHCPGNLLLRAELFREMGRLHLSRAAN